MTKFTKISAIALLSLFLGACDKPATSSTAVTPEQIAESKATENGADDFKKYQIWQREQEQELNEVLRKTMQGADSKADEKTVQLALANAVSAQIEKIQESAKNLVLQDSEVQALKDKALEVMTLGVRLLTASNKAENNEEAQKEVILLSQELQIRAEEGQALESSLMQKYGIPVPAREEPEVAEPQIIAPAVESQQPQGPAPAEPAEEEEPYDPTLIEIPRAIK